MAQLQGVDPVEGTEIMELLGASWVDLDDPARYKRIKEVVDYFTGKPDKRSQILKIIQGKGGDAVDNVWGWVELMKNREEKMRSLSKKEFTEDIQKELENKYLTKDNLNIIKKQTKERITAEQKMKEKRSEEREKAKEAKKGVKAVEKAEESSNLQQIQRTVEEIEEINNELSYY